MNDNLSEILSRSLGFSTGHYPIEELCMSKRRNHWSDGRDQRRRKDTGCRQVFTRKFPRKTKEEKFVINVLNVASEKTGASEKFIFK